MNDMIIEVHSFLNYKNYLKDHYITNSKSEFIKKRQIENREKINFFQSNYLTCHVKQKNSLGKIKLFQFE
ncbi:hypothetical protein BpHYR1_008950 [Brachionus plicatilis]|uniref:Uncharacterized protein n=1 Tax=Brachionus plicatilis TaxID=10195 RepID=A0A3M7SD79_BRAPC|nr:hypothetical protein BpHYR1_008950 [Brachionus plicatilis]